jgi:hypothetical protein
MILKFLLALLPAHTFFSWVGLLYVMRKVVPEKKMVLEALCYSFSSALG